MFVLFIIHYEITLFYYNPRLRLVQEMSASSEIVYLRRDRLRLMTFVTKSR